jgi:hypothetical protein
MNPALALFQSIGGVLLTLVVIVIVGWFAISRIRSWMKDNAEAAQPFTLDDLRQLHRSGQLSDEEYERAKEMMIGSVRRAPTLKEIKAAQAKSPRVAPPTAPLADALKVKPQRPRGLEQAALDAGSDVSNPQTNSTPNPQPSQPLPSPAATDGTQPTKSPKRPPQLG